jgi:hypothetical protein
MPEHSLSPTTDIEVATLIKRINELAGRVMNHQEWKSMFSATRHLLPHSGSRTMEPAELDLVQMASSRTGRVVVSVVAAFASSETYKNNQRYNIYTWIDLVRDFYAISSYALSYPRLEYAAEILRRARKTSADDFIAAASVVALNEPLCVRQFVSSFDLDGWNKSLSERLKTLADEGAEFLSAARREEDIDPGDYSDWFANSEDLIDLATNFFEAFRYSRPSDLRTLKDLMDEVPVPSDEDSDSQTDDYDRSNAGDYWTVARIFEDL